MTSRRALVVGAVATVGTTIPAPASAGERIRASVAARRAAWTARRDDLVRRVSGGRRLDEEQRSSLERLGDGLGALGALKSLGLPSVDEQAHPAFQALLRDIAEAVGRAVVVGAERLDAFLPGAGHQEEAGLRDAAERLRASLPSWQVDELGREQIDTHLGGLLGSGAEGELLRGSRRVRDRARQAQRLGEELQARDWSSGMVASGASAEEVADARGRWAGEWLAPERTPSHSEGSYVAIGVLLLGLVVIEGLVLLVATCAAGCSGNGTALVAVILLGVLLIAVTVVGAIWAFSKAAESRRWKRRETVLLDGDAPGEELPEDDE